jgi:hypothetical protein
MAVRGGAGRAGAVTGRWVAGVAGGTWRGRRRRGRCRQSPLVTSLRPPRRPQRARAPPAVGNHSWEKLCLPRLRGRRRAGPLLTGGRASGAPRRVPQIPARPGRGRRPSRGRTPEHGDNRATPGGTRPRQGGHGSRDPCHATPRVAHQEANRPPPGPAEHGKPSVPRPGNPAAGCPHVLSVTRPKSHPPGSAGGVRRELSAHRRAGGAQAPPHLTTRGRKLMSGGLCSGQTAPPTLIEVSAWAGRSGPPRPASLTRRPNVRPSI